MQARISSSDPHVVSVVHAADSSRLRDDNDVTSLEGLADAAFGVRDGASAAWIVRKVVESRAYAERVRTWAASELRRTEREEAWFLQRFGAQLEGWLRTELERQGGRRRSIALPSGTVGLRQQPARLEVTNERLIAEWCRGRLPEAVRICVEAEGAAALDLAAWCADRGDEMRQRQHILREPLNRHFAETGELPDGSSVRPSQDQLYVK